MLWLYLTLCRFILSSKHVFHVVSCHWCHQKHEVNTFELNLEFFLKTMRHISQLYVRVLWNQSLQPYTWRTTKTNKTQVELSEYQRNSTGTNGSIIWPKKTPLTTIRFGKASMINVFLWWSIDDPRDVNPQNGNAWGFVQVQDADEILFVSDHVLHRLRGSAPALENDPWEFGRKKLVDLEH